MAATIAIAGLDRGRFAGQRNTANKLRTVRAAMALPSPDHERLRAIGRARECLFHCAPMVRRGDQRIAERRLALADRLTPSPEELHDLCRFYDRIAIDLVHACARYLGDRERAKRYPPAKGRIGRRTVGGTGGSWQVGSLSLARSSQLRTCADPSGPTKTP